MNQKSKTSYLVTSMDQIYTKERVLIGVQVSIDIQLGNMMMFLLLNILNINQKRNLQKIM